MSDGIRTRDIQSHSLALYQAELRSPSRRTRQRTHLHCFVTSGREECQLRGVWPPAGEFSAGSFAGISWGSVGCWQQTQLPGSKASMLHTSQ